MAKEKAQEAEAAPTKATVTPIDAAKPEFNIADFSPSVRAEFVNLMNIERLLKRVKGIDGDEAFAYVDARRYITEKAAMLKVSEEARLKALKTTTLKKNAAPEADASAETPVAEATA